MLLMMALAADARGARRSPVVGMLLDSSGASRALFKNLNRDSVILFPFPEPGSTSGQVESIKVSLQLSSRLLQQQRLLQKCSVLE
jgi:hypothetical protein